MYLDSAKKRKRHESKPNIFSLATSLSDKCLMQGYYKKIINYSAEKEDEIEKIHAKLVIKKK